jgi:hypothetical protein
MTVSTDVLASTPLAATGQATDAAGNNMSRARVKGMYIIPGALAGTVVLRDGGASGPIKATIPTVALATFPTYVPIPENGLLFTANIHCTLANVTSVTFFYA